MSNKATPIPKKEIDLFIEKFNQHFKKSYRVTNGRTIKLRLRLKIYSIEEILQALENLASSPFHRGVNDRGWDANPDFLIRNDEQVDKWLNYDSFQAEKISSIVRSEKHGNRGAVDARHIK